MDDIQRRFLEVNWHHAVVHCMNVKSGCYLLDATLKIIAKKMIVFGFFFFFNNGDANITGILSAQQRKSVKRCEEEREFLYSTRNIEK